MRKDYKYWLRCIVCGAEIYTNYIDRSCYKCENSMIPIDTKNERNN